MEIKRTNELSEAEKQQVTELEKLSFAPEALENHAYLSSDINFDPALPCFYLGFEAGALLAFLTTFQPGREEAEVMAFTHPAHRRRGLYRQLYAAAAADVRAAGIPDILLEVEAKSTTGAAVLQTYAARQYDHTEYRMVLTAPAAPPKPGCPALRAERLTPAGKAAFGKITTEAFGRPEEEGYLDTIIKSEERRGFLVWEGDTPVGTFVLGQEKDGLFLYGVAVSPALHGKGYGTALLHCALQTAARARVILEVDSDNPAALALYRSAGFTPEFQVDYYRVKA